MRLGDQGAHLRLLPHGVAHFEGLGGGDQSLFKLLINIGMDKGSGARNAGLSRGAENAKQHTRQCVIEIGIGANDRGRLATEFQGGGHQFFSRYFTDGQTHRCAAREGHSFDQRVTQQLIADHGAFACNDGQNAVG